MTVSNQTNRTSATGSGSAGQEVAFSFPITSTSDLIVISRVTATGAETTLTETTNYTVSITGDTGGTLTTVTAVATTAQIHLVRNTPMTQSLDLEQGGTFSAENIEDAFDKVTKLVIDNAHADASSNISPRVITAPKTDADSIVLELPNTVDRASKYFTFDASGNVTATTAEEAGVVAFGAFGETFVAVASASAAQTALGISAFVKTLLDDATAVAFLATLGLTVSAYAKTILDDAAATNVLTTLGFSAYAKTLIDDASAAATRTTLGALAVGDIVSYENDIVFYENEVVID